MRFLFLFLQVIIRGNMSFHEDWTRDELLDLHTNMENLTYIGPKLYTRSWMRGMYNYLERRPQLKANITNEAEFIQVLETVSASN